MKDVLLKSAAEDVGSELILRSLTEQLSLNKHLSIIIPTYNEKNNIHNLVQNLFSVFNRNEIRGEVIIVDDNSPDGTGLLVEELREKYKDLKVVHRKGKLGLSSAVLDGSKIADSDILCVMDADLSHSPESIPLMLREIHNGADFVIGSRYIKGGKIEGWTSYRKFISKGATLLSKLVVKEVKDPMSGFFMIKKEYLAGINFNAKGFKICLEFLVKAHYNKVTEVPITFINRKEGRSKASLKEYYLLLLNLTSYILYKEHILSKFLKFGAVGVAGTLINLVVLYELTELLDVHYLYSAMFAFMVAVTHNFVLNKVWTFHESLRYQSLRKYMEFLVVSSIALVVNILSLYLFTEYFGLWYMVAQLLAIGIAAIVNFVGNKIWTFNH